MPFFSEALEMYQRDLGEDTDDKPFSARRRASQRFIEVAGDLPMDQYGRAHVRAFLDHLLDDDLKTTTVRRYVNYVSPVFSMAVREYDLDRQVFEHVPIPKLGEDSSKREPFIAKAKAEGRYKGRQPTASEKAGEVKRFLSEGLSKREVAAKLNISERSVYRYVQVQN